MLFIIIGILVYLTFIIAPTANEKNITLVVIIGAAISAMQNLFGAKDMTAEKLKEEVVELRAALAVLRAEYTAIKEEYDRITELLVRKHVVRGLHRVVKLARPKVKIKKPRKPKTLRIKGLTK
jgi:hypothetical protein